MKFNIDFDLTDFGFTIRIYKTRPYAKYKICLDFQIAWVSFWWYFGKRGK
jgi:hypothetical protein